MINVKAGGGDVYILTLFMRLDVKDISKLTNRHSVMNLEIKKNENSVMRSSGGPKAGPIDDGLADWSKKA
jgi:hypothetical protein